MSTVTYNGYTFPSWSQVRVSMNYVQSSANVHTKYVQYTVTVSTIVVNESGCGSPSNDVDFDLFMAELRATLAVEGQDLLIKDAGFGTNFHVKIGGKQDVMHGPKPRSMQWEPIGTTAARITWVCEATVARCPYQLKDVAEYEYAITWAIDENGMTVRTITGQLEIAGWHTKQGTSGTSAPIKFSSTVDAYRDQILFPELSNFHRQQSFSRSPDHRTLAFTITDTEIPSDNPYPVGIVRPNLSYSISSTGEILSGNAAWSVNLSGSFEVAPGFSKQVAWSAMFETVKKIRESLNKSGKKEIGSPSPGDNVNVTAKVPQNYIIAKRLQITDHVFSRNISISLEWLLLCSLDDLLEASGIWEPLPKEATWERWKGSMEKVTRLRGHAALRDFNQDLIIGLCTSPTFVSPGENPNVNPLKQKKLSVLGSDTPPPEQSWIKYQNDPYIIEDTNTATHRLLSVPNDIPEVQGDAAYRKSINGPQVSVSMSPGDLVNPLEGQVVLQNRGVPHYLLGLQGHAIRASYGIPIPAALQVGNIKLEGVRPVSRSFQQKKFRTVDKLPLYAMKWNVVYSIPGTPVGDLSRDIVMAGETFNIS